MPTVTTLFLSIGCTKKFNGKKVGENLMLSYKEVDNREYSDPSSPTIKDIAIALFHWSQYQWSTLSDYEIDMRILKRIKHMYPIATNVQEEFLYRGVSVSEEDISKLHFGDVIYLDSSSKTLPCTNKIFESWATSYSAASHFAIRSKTGRGVVLKKEVASMHVEWVAKHITGLIPQEIRIIYTDLQDREDEVVIAKPQHAVIALDDVAAMYRGEEIIENH